MDSREAAWDAVHDAMPAGWRAGPTSIADPLRGIWSVTAVDMRTTGRGRIPECVSGVGEDETAALSTLAGLLRNREDAGGRLEELRTRARLTCAVHPFR